MKESKYKIVEVFDKKSKPVEIVIMEVFKEYCAKKLKENDKKTSKILKL